MKEGCNQSINLKKEAAIFSRKRGNVRSRGQEAKTLTLDGVGGRGAVGAEPRAEGDPGGDGAEAEGVAAAVAPVAEEELVVLVARAAGVTDLIGGGVEEEDVVHTMAYLASSEPAKLPRTASLSTPRSERHQPAKPRGAKGDAPPPPWWVRKHGEAQHERSGRGE
jgi:hypothetical protein